MKILKKWYNWTYLQNRNRIIDVENKHAYPGGGGGREGIDWEFEIGIYTLWYLK